MAIGERHDEVLEGGFASLRPSTADSTEIAGVITAVAEKHRGADDAEQEHAARCAVPSARVASAVSESVPPSPLLSARSRIEHVFDGDHDDQRPQDQREHAEHDVARDRADAARRRHGLAKRIERAGADVAIDDADAAERQRPEARILPLARLRNPAGWQPAQASRSLTLSIVRQGEFSTHR